MSQRPEEISIIDSFKVPLILLSIMWLVFGIEWLFEIKHLGRWGIYPRSKDGLLGILFSPFIHGDYQHIVNNSGPTVVLGACLFYFYRKIAWEILIVGTFITGLFAWLIARPNFHIGMSGVIYMLAFFLFFSGLFRKETKLMGIALLVVFLYGSIVWGLFPIDVKMSFESHIAGAITGILLAYFYKKEGATFDKKKYQWEIDEENDKKLKAQGYYKVEDENGFTIKYKHKDDIE